MRAFLENVMKRQIPVTYQTLARAFQILSPHSLHRVAEAPERLLEEDVEADRPFIAVLTISGLATRPGCVPRVGMFIEPTRPLPGAARRRGQRHQRNNILVVKFFLRNRLLQLCG